MKKCVAQRHTVSSHNPTLLSDCRASLHPCGAMNKFQEGTGKCMKPAEVACPKRLFKKDFRLKNTGTGPLRQVCLSTSRFLPRELFLVGGKKHTGLFTAAAAKLGRFSTHYSSVGGQNIYFRRTKEKESFGWP